MVKSSSPNAPSTWLIFLCPRTHSSTQTCQHSASSVLAVRISWRVIAMFVFRKPLFTVIMASKRKSTDFGCASKPKKGRDFLSISEEVKILNVIEIQEKVCGDCQVVCQERIFHSWSDEKQVKKFHCSIVSWGLG